MSVVRSSSLQPGEPVLELRNVARRFVKRRERNRSFQDKFVRLLSRRNVIEEVTSEKDLLPVAMALAREIASKAPLAMAYAKRAANMVDLMPQRDAYRFEQEFTYALSKTEDAREARMAFLEKRAPVFKGR